MIHFLNRNNWNVIERGRVFDAVSYYNTDTRRPLTFFIPDETQQDGQPITGKLVESPGDLESVMIDGVMKSPEHKVVVGMKQRRVVALSNNQFSQNNSYEYIYVAPTNEGYERYMSLTQITSIHKVIDTITLFCPERIKHAYWTDINEQKVA